MKGLTNKKDINASITILSNNPNNQEMRIGESLVDPKTCNRDQHNKCILVLELIIEKMVELSIQVLIHSRRIRYRILVKGQALSRMQEYLNCSLLL